MDRYIIDHEARVIEALRRLNELSGDMMALVVVDGDSRVVGTLTDGDIRRALAAGGSQQEKVSAVMHRQFRALRQGTTDIELMRTLRNEGIRMLPVVDSDGRLVRLLDLHKTSTLLPLSAVIMAGGRGERLRPLTDTLPKPLLEIGGKAIIDYNVEALVACGINDIVVTTHYLADKIVDHFSADFDGVTVRCVNEDSPRGTIGALALVGELSHDNVIVMNSDLLTDISFEEMFQRHESAGADITVAVIPYTVAVPYAILETDGDRVTSLEEKPVYSHYANAGIYIIGKDARNMIGSDERIDATDLIALAIARGLKVTYFPINGTWIDVGTPADFRHACDIMKYHRHR